ncbi:MAG: hybrid sensor histidine kinase/response regulator [Planctomycetaceae bacterium]
MADDLSGFSMLDLFRLEADTQAAVLSAGVLAIERIDQDPGTIEAMMRAAHSLKGAARIVGVEPAVVVAHALEDCFVAAGRGEFRVEPAHADLLLECIDFLSSIGKADDVFADDSPWPARAARLVEALGGLQRSPGRPAAAPAAPAPPAAPVAVAVPEAGPPSTDVAPAPTRQAGAAPADAGGSAPGDRSGADRGFETLDRVVRVSADSLTRLVGLAGEALVETRQLRPFVDGLATLRSAQVDLCDTLAALEDRAGSEGALPASLTVLVERARALADKGLAALIDYGDDFETFARRNEDLSGRLHHEVIVSRMRPIADGIRAFPRLVRDLARSLGKQIRYEVRGEGTGVDRDILDKLEAPLTHLLRNAIDHGIESPAERRAAGKPAEGSIVLEARHRAGMLQILLVDDGRGIDVGSIRDRAVERDLVPRHVAERLSESEVLEFMFLPGFSTRRRVTEISGRGVGLDVVQSMVKAVGGGVRVSSLPGRQTAFALQLPITMSVVRALLVEVAGEPYAFPLTRIDSIQFVSHADVRSVEGRQFFQRDEASIGLVSAAQVLGTASPPPSADPMPVVVISDRGQQFGMIVEAFLGERDLEVRPLDARLGKVADVNSVSLLEDGSPVLIVDVEDLVLSIDNLLMGRRIARLDFRRDPRRARRTKRVLVVDDSITVRELERQLLQTRGFEVDVAVDGMDGWNAIRGGDYDLVVSDIDMPRLDGIGLVSLIKADPARKQIPVVIVSYKDREEDRLRGLEAGANRYLTKTSFHDQTFIATIIDLIGEPIS